MAIKLFTGLALVAALAGATALYYWPDSSMPARTITIGSSTVMVDVADTPALRQLGLSGRPSLSDGEGMLFVFEEDGRWAIWMKDMLFSIDILWLDAQGRVVSIAEDVSPETYPQSFTPSEPARYVLEIPAGSVARYGIAEGGQIML